MSRPPRRQFPCRSCGRTIVADDNAKSISHELPECETFARLMASSPAHSITADVIDTTEIPVSPIFREN